MTRGALVALALLSCAQPPVVQGKAWPAFTLFAAPTAPFLGPKYPNSILVITPSADGGTPSSIPWRTSDYEDNAPVNDGKKAFVVQPAYQAGDVAAYVVTEIWDTHPDLWIQPAYHVIKGGKVDHGVFGVGADSTFYSPYWRIYNADEGTTDRDLTTVKQIVDDELPVTKGPLWVCPIVPDGVTGFTPDPATGVAVHPFTHDPVTPPDDYGPAFADGRSVQYLNFGERQVGQLYEEGADGTVEAEDFYMFARQELDGGRTPLQLPAVLADDAATHAYVRRVDVLLENEFVFVPTGRDTLLTNVQKMLKGTNATAEHPTVTIDPTLQLKYMLRVATDDSCFGPDAGTSFPDGCHWLDSEQAIDDLPASRLIDSTVTLTATPVMLGGKKL